MDDDERSRRSPCDQALRDQDDEVIRVLGDDDPSVDLGNTEDLVVGAVPQTEVADATGLVTQAA